MTCPFFPETILPSCSRGFPATAMPCPVSRWNQAIHRSMTCCISSGESTLYQSVPRKISMYPIFVCVLITFLVGSNSVGRGRDQHHPEHAEFVGHHAETRGKEGLRERH